MEENIKIYLPPSKKRIPEYSDDEEVKIYVSKSIQGRT